MLTRPRGSRNATLDSIATALKDRNASANDSAFLPNPAVGTVPETVSLDAAVDVATGDLKRVAHDLGRALAGGEKDLISSEIAGSGPERVDLRSSLSASVDGNS